MRNLRPYGAFTFLSDIILTAGTGGVWFLWIAIRESMRNRNQRLKLQSLVQRL